MARTAASMRRAIPGSISSAAILSCSPPPMRLDPETVERASAAAAAFPTSGIVFSDQAEMSADGASKRLMPLDLPPQRGHFSADEFVRLMQRNFFYFHVSSAWFNVKLLRALGGFPPEL